jgi:two-component system sensor histidine kinase QseC
VQERDDLVKDIAGQLIEPGLWLLPVVFLALGLAIWRGLRPLYALSDDVARLDVGQGQRLPAHHAMGEFNSVVHSINNLVEQQNAALRRERRLANEVAHELRTPLASIVLQARALGGPLTDADRHQALARIGEDALRASRVLGQLLMLARTSRAELHEAAVPLDLAALARQVSAEYAQQAWERQDDIAVAGLDTLPLQGHPLLLEQALRNLLENALKHTPAGTQIEVRLGLDTTADGDVPWLRVSDDGARAGAAEPGPPEPRTRATDSLRLGHEIITRVAELHGARFGAEPAQPPFTTCFALRFRPTAAAQPPST